jgi:hypothetical protein
MQLSGGRNNAIHTVPCNIESQLNLFAKKDIAHFRLPYQPFGYQDTERAIEIPWSLSIVRTNDVVLDVGYAYAEPRYLNELCNLPLKELHGIDYVLNDQLNPKIRKAKCDIRNIDCYSPAYFDTILCVSTIEHVGFDNNVYFTEEHFQKNIDDDLLVVQGLVKLLKKNGRLVITVPFGRLVDYGWFMQYDGSRLNRLIEFSKCRVGVLEYFIYKNDGWYNSSAEELASVEYKGNDAPAAAGIACLLLIKK